MRAVLVVLALLAVTGWGTAVGLGAAVVALRHGDDIAAGQGADETGPGPAVAGPADGPGAGTYTLTVHTDGCGVVRTEGPGGSDLDGLTWSVVDADGFEVLGRNALGETHYRYFSAGTFEVVLEAWGGDSYVPVSNAVSITC